jgi:hypothetical protein
VKSVVKNSPAPLPSFPSVKNPCSYVIHLIFRQIPPLSRRNRMKADRHPRFNSLTV